MKRLLSSSIISLIVIAALVIPDMSQRITVLAITLSSSIQQDARITLSQIEDLIIHGTPDSAIAIEIQQRRLAFRLNANLLARLKSLNAGPKTIQALQAFLPKPRITRTEIHEPPDPNKVTILVADFKSLSERNFGVTEKVLQRLRAETHEYSDINVEALGQSVSEQQGSKLAREIGQQRKASIVLWGYYNATPEAVDISVYFEVLRKPKYLYLRKNLVSEISPISELNGFKTQTRLSIEMTYLTLLTVGLARYEARDYDGAIKRFTKAIDQSGVPDQMIEPAYIYFYRAAAYHYKEGANGIDKAIADYNRAVEIKRDLENAYNNRGVAYSDKGEYDRAIADYNKAIEIEPDLAEAYDNRGNAYGKKGQYDRAIADHDKAIDLNPNNAATYYNRGTTYHKKGQYDRAILDFDRAIQIEPNDAATYYNRGLAYGKQGQHDRAILDFDKAIKFKPDFADAYYNRGYAYGLKGQYDRAVTDYGMAIKFKPDFADAYYNRAITYGEKGQHDRAIADYNKAIEIEPDHPNAYNNRGNAYSKKRQHDRAILDYDKAIELKSDLAEAYYNRGNAYGLKNEIDRAIADFSKAIEIKPDYAEAYNNRGLAYGLKGEYDRTILDLKQVLRITNDPKLRQLAQQLLQKLGVK
jgi:tetratricopeptide (TPR) repeat protein